jgi:hypothetical protein
LGWDIKSQSLNSTGVIQWPVGGEIVCSAFDDQVNVSHVTDNNGGAVYVWEDHRNFSNYDLYATHFYSSGTVNYVGVKELTNENLLQSLCFPNPINTNSTIQLNNNLSNHSWEITIYDAFGNLKDSQFLNGNETYSLNAEKYSNGIYFYFITIKGSSSFSKGSFISAN